MQVLGTIDDAVFIHFIFKRKKFMSYVKLQFIHFSILCICFIILCLIRKRVLIYNIWIQYFLQCYSLHENKIKQINNIIIIILFFVNYNRN